MSQLLKGLRFDLEKMRIIADVVRKRERVKQAQSEAVQDVLLHFLFPHEGPLRLAFQKITAYASISIPWRCFLNDYCPGMTGRMVISRLP